jgi:hypothetical protein
MWEQIKIIKTWEWDEEEEEEEEEKQEDYLI